MTSGAKNKNLAENLNENPSHLGTPLGFATMLIKDRENVGYCYPIKGGVLCVFCG
jgi:hypothetical protein